MRRKNSFAQGSGSTARMRSKRVKKSGGKHQPALGPTKIKVRVKGCQRARKLASWSRKGRHSVPRRAKARRCQFNPPLRSGRGLNCRPSSWRQQAPERDLRPQGNSHFDCATPPSRSYRSGRQRGTKYPKGHKSPAQLACKYYPPNMCRLHILGGRCPLRRRASQA